MEQRQPVKTVQVGALSEKRKGLVHKGERTKSPQEPSSFLQSNLQAPQVSALRTSGQLSGLAGRGASHTVES